MSKCPFCEPPAEQVFLRDGPFDLDLDPAEWSATLRLLTAVRDQVAIEHNPAGWNLGMKVSSGIQSSVPSSPVKHGVDSRVHLVVPEVWGESEPKSKSRNRRR